MSYTGAGTLIAALVANSITAPFQYVPLHSSPAGLRARGGRACVTDDAASRLLRLQIWAGTGERNGRVIEVVRRGLR